jgi:hypothetical protein
MNDLIFWGIQICIIAIALGIIWIRLDATGKVLVKLVSLQNDELVSVRKQTRDAEDQTKLIKENEDKRLDAFKQITTQQKVLMDNTEASTNDILDRVKVIASDVTTTLDQIKLISKAVVGEAVLHEQKAIQAEGAANTAKQQAIQAEGVAAKAKTKAAATSGALAQKKRQLNKATQVIATEKKKNPLQRMFQPVGQ